MKENLNFLLLDDDAMTRQYLSEYLVSLGFKVFTAASADVAFVTLAREEIHVMILDIYMPEMSGIEVLAKVKRDLPAVEVIMITGEADSDCLMEAVKLGAFDYFRKPLQLPDLRAAIERTRRYLELTRRLEVKSRDHELLEEEVRKIIGPEIIGESAVMRAMIDLSLKAAGSRNTNVLVVGPSGSGKELVARMIHRASERRNRIFNAVNCSAIPSALVESEFFGHVKGAFTGAVEDKLGAFEASDGGTLFIDEIGDMPLPAQSALLRILETRKVKRIGSQKEISVDVRVVSATHRDLNELILEGKFRLDLFYRINSFEIRVPALNERREDVPRLFNHFLQFYAREMKKNIEGVDKDVGEILSGYDFPGNVRELRNMAERAVILCEGGIIKLKHLPIISQKLKDSPGTNSFPRALENGNGVEKAAILEVLKKTGGNYSEAASLLSISRFALRRKMQKLGIEKNFAS